MAALSRTILFLVAWTLFLTVHICQCCMEGEGHFGWRCDTSNGCFCKQGQRCQKTLGNCPEHCVDNPWGIGCEDEPDNLAYGKAITQTNMYTEGGATYPGSLALDGDNSTDNLKCYRSLFVHDPTWSVDLGGLYVIRKVIVFKPITEATICHFEGVDLCINNGTGGGCKDITESPTFGPNGKCPIPVFEYSIDPPILASSVTIHKQYKQILRLCEVIVRGYTYPYNIAFGKTASQNSMLNNAVARRAVDGNVDPMGSCTQTAVESFPWWRVDLGQQYVVYSVTLFNRAGPDGDLLRNVQIKLRNSTDTDYVTCVTHDSALPRGVGTELVCMAPIVGQVLIVQVNQNPGSLSLCEVTIKGYKYDDCPNKNTGPGCKTACNCKDENEQCHRVSAFCTSGCPAGWYGSAPNVCQVESPYLIMAPSITSRTQTSVTLSWQKWSPQTGPGVGVVQNYVIKAWRDGVVVSNVTVPKDNDTWTMGRLNQYTQYNFTVSIISDAGSGLPSPATTAGTCGVPIVPPPPNITSILDHSNRSADIELVTRGMEETGHRCDSYKQLNIQYEWGFGKSGSIAVLQVTQSQLINITNLPTYSSYTIRVSAVNNLDLEGPVVTINHTTAEGLPPKMESPNVVTVETTSIEIEWRAPSPPGGVISQYELSYRNQSNIWNQVLIDPVSTRRNIDNLQMNSTYQFRIRARTTVGFGEYSDVLSQATESKTVQMPATGTTSVSSTNGGAIAGGVIAALVAAGVVVGTSVFAAKKRRQQRREGPGEAGFSELHDKGEPPDPATNKPKIDEYENAIDENLYGNVVHSKIEVADILEVMKQKTRDLLKAEYEKLPTIFISQCNAGQKPENKLKNRFKNIMPYDHSRVVLEPVADDPHSDYINANYIDGYGKPKAFIAAQGPKPNTVKDFWRMIWQVNAPQIVMVTKTVESARQKCEQYWASGRGKSRFGDVEVQTVDEVEEQEYFVRTLQYSKDGDSSVRTVKQFHFTGWPDHGVPLDPTALVKFREEVKNYQTQVHDQGPIIVHCSAGVGRTGTFIALDYLFEQANAEGKIDIFQLVQAMRESRPKMVQTVEQYLFVHDVMLEELHCGLTLTPVQDLVTHLNKLRRKEKSGVTRMEDEFDILNLTLPEIEESSIKTALDSKNIEKNRVRNIVAGDTCRPMLVSYKEGSTDYINAVFVDGYQRIDAYIVTQMPMPHTVVDFWSMIYDQQCATIVMLNEASEDNKLNWRFPQTSAVYWPEEKGSVSYDHFTVELMSTHQSGDVITVRELKLANTNNKREGPPRTIRQFHLQNWQTSKPVPPSATSLLNLYDEVQQWQRKSGNTTITVHCMNGAHQSGVFCAMARILEKLNVEQEVDVFHTVKAIRQNRPQLIDSKEQYFFCYDIVEEYAHRFDTYANFQM